MKIYAPVKDTNGVYASVKFVNGVGETNSPHLIEWFKEHNFKVEEVNSITEVSNEQVELKVEVVEEEPDDEVMGYSDKPNTDELDKMTPNELRDWAKANGFGSVIKNIRNKEKLLELIRG